MGQGQPAMLPFGVVEGGGTKFLCSSGTGPQSMAYPVRTATRDPESTLADVIAYFRAHPVCAIGVAMFGPLELRPGPDFGSTLGTPKAGWERVPVARTLREALGVPVFVDTDVNAAAMAENRWGVARGCSPVLYVTVGTGIGAGVVIAGKPLHGLMHPEFGHVLLPAAVVAGEVDRFVGICAKHRRCLEGMASGPALQARTGKSGATLAADDSAWDWTASYLGMGLAAATLMLAPERIVLGGGVMRQRHLLPRVRRCLQQSLNGYLPRAELEADIDCFVVAPHFEEVGLAGAFALLPEHLSPERLPSERQPPEGDAI